MLLAAWRYRFFIISSIKTELRTKFIRSRLGGLWMILNPLAQVLIFAFVLSAVLSAGCTEADRKALVTAAIARCRADFMWDDILVAYAAVVDRLAAR